MAIGLLVVFIILFIIEYRLQRSFIAPLSLFLLSFIMALLLISINTANWEVHLNSTFILYILTATVSFATGTFVVELIGHRKKANAGDIKEETPVLEMPSDRYPALALLIISGICMILYFVLMLRKTGISGGISTILYRVYLEVTTGKSSSFLMHQMIKIVIAISQINVFELFLLRYLVKGRERIVPYSLIGIQLLFFAMCAILSTDRNIVLRFFIYILCLWIFFETFSGSENSNKRDFVILLKAVLSVLVVVLLFYALGKLRKNASNFGRAIGIYGGSGLYNFNLFLLRDNKPMFGESTFLLLNNTLRSFGLLGGNSSETIIVDDFVIFLSKNGYVYSSNIYSAMRPYVEDFGYFGVILFPFIMGIFFEILYMFAKKYRYGFAWVFYAFMIYPVVYFTVLEQCFRRLHLGIIYEIGWFTLLYVLIFVAGKRVPERKMRMNHAGNNPEAA